MEAEHTALLSHLHLFYCHLVLSFHATVTPIFFTISWDFLFKGSGKIIWN